MAHSGAGASFELADSGDVLQQIAPYLNDIAVSDDQDELDASVFSPNATVPLKTVIYGATEKTYTLSGRWSAAIHTILDGIQGATDQAFAYGPLGNTSGYPKFSGTVNVGRIQGPQQSSDGVIGFSISLKVVTETYGTY